MPQVFYFALGWGQVVFLLVGQDEQPQLHEGFFVPLMMRMKTHTRAIATMKRAMMVCIIMTG